MTKDEALKLALSALNEVRQETSRLMKDSQTLYSEKKVWEAIYTIKKVLSQPKQDTWVGLTNDEVNNFAAGCHLGKSVQGAIYEAEAKLKQKNNG